MSNMTDTYKRLSFNNESITTTIDVPSWCSIVEMYLYPNGGDNASLDYPSMRFNSDTGSNYSTYKKYWSQSGGYTFAATGAANWITVSKAFATPATDHACTSIVFYPRTDTEYNSGFQELMMGDNATNNETITTEYFEWLNTTDPITSINLFSTGGANISLDVEIKFIR